MTLMHRTLAVLACLVAVTPIAPPHAIAAPPSGPGAVLRGGHFSPDTPSVDVYLTNFAGGTTTLALSDVGYGDVSKYQRIEPGLYTVGMRPAGADPTTPVAISWTLDAKPGGAFTACAIGMHDALQGRVLSDDLTAPGPDKARVRIIQAASRAPKADVVAQNGPQIGSQVPFAATTGYATVAAGSWPVTARSADNPKGSATTDVTLRPGVITTLVVLDTPQGDITLRTLTDGVGPTDVPTGPVAAGGDANLPAVSGIQTSTVVASILAAVAMTVTLCLLAAMRHHSRLPR